MKRISHESAFVLHHYDWSESSLILELFTRGQGRIALIAKGVKRPSSQFRPVLLPLQALSISFSRPLSDEAEVGTLKAAEWLGGQTMPTGHALLSGYYVNELVMRLLARDDPHPALFEAYAQTVACLRHTPTLHCALRAFEFVLLKEIGLLPALDLTSVLQTPLDPLKAYWLTAEGLHPSNSSALPHPEQTALPAPIWQAIAHALNHSPSHLCMASLQTVIGAASPVQQHSIKTQLRHLLNHHVGARGLQTRALIRDALNVKMEV